MNDDIKLPHVHAVDILQDVDCAKCGSKSLYLVIQQEYRAKACDECGYEERLDEDGHE